MKRVIPIIVIVGWTILFLFAIPGCTTTHPSPGQRTLIGYVAQPWCLLWCTITSTVTDGEAGANVKGATVTTTESVSATSTPVSQKPNN